MNSLEPVKNRSKPLVLIVDDVSKNLQDMTEMLIEEGCDTAAAMNGKQALGMAQELMPDLVIMDVMMPGMDGIEVCRQLRNTPSTRDMPVILLTLENATDDIVKGFEAGAVDYALKPFISREFTSRAKHQLALRQLRETNARCIAEIASVSGEKERIEEERNQLFQELKKKDDLLEKMSVTDDLTGLYNHKYILRRLAQEIAQARRYGHDLSLLLFDIDHFRRVNDKFGHKVGDEVLARLAASIMDTLREADVAGRYSGQEFMAILSHTDLDGGIITAERVRTNITELIWPYENLQITVSGGISTLANELLPGTRAKSDNLMYKLIMKADKLLYRAKEKGRNRIEADR